MEIHNFPRIQEMSLPEKKIAIFSLIQDDDQWRIQKILVGGDLKRKTSKIRMSSPKLRVIFRP